MENEFTIRLSEMLALSGKSITRIAALADINRSFCARIFSGERKPSYRTLLKIYLAIMLDEDIIRRDPTMIYGFEELVLAAATVPAS